MSTFLQQLTLTLKRILPGPRRIVGAAWKPPMEHQDSEHQRWARRRRWNITIRNAFEVDHEDFEDTQHDILKSGCGDYSADFFTHDKEGSEAAVYRWFPTAVIGPYSADPNDPNMEGHASFWKNPVDARDHEKYFGVIAFGSENYVGNVAYSVR